MIKIIINNKKSITSPLLVVLMITVLLPRLAMAKETSILNSISVLSDSSGSATITTKTIIDGVTREDSHYETSGTSTLQAFTKLKKGSAQMTSNSTSFSRKTNAELLLMIEKLNVLIQYYVLLLNKTS